MNNRTNDCSAVSQAGSLRSKANQITEETLKITENLVVMCDESAAIGATTLTNLDIQDDKIKKVEKGIDNMEANMKKAEKHLTGMETWFGFAGIPRRSGSKIKNINAHSPSNIVSGDASKGKSIGGSTTDFQCLSGNTQYIQRINNDPSEDQMEENMKRVAVLTGVMKDTAIKMGEKIDNHNETLVTINLKATILNSKIDSANKRVASLH